MKQHQPGKDFEIEVEGLLTALGYEVTRDIRIGGAQLDIIGQRKSDLLGDVIIVECKDYTSSVGTAELAEFQSKLLSARTAYPQARGCIVTKSEFTADAKERARLSGIALVTRSQLLNSLLNCDAWLTRFIYTHENSDMFHLFVEPKCVWRDTPGKDAKNKIPLVQSVCAWAMKPGPAGLVILGDYGTGKTVSCERLTYELAKLKLSGKELTAPVPLLFYLKDYYRTLDLRSMITDRLVNDLGINLPFEIFLQFLLQGVFCIILDGFDEMAMRVDSEVRTRNLLLLQSLSSGRSKVIITGRPGYFPTDREIEEVLNSSFQRDVILLQQLHPQRSSTPFSFIDVSLFERDEISEYFNRYYRFAEATGKAIEKINLDDLTKVYNLLSLAERPVLLSLILETGPKIFEKGEKQFTAGDLYRQYTRAWIEREHGKGEFRRLLEPRLKLIFMQELAWDMYCRKVFTVNYQDSLPDSIIEYFGPTASKEFDYLDSDIRACSYIVRDENGNYSFAHKSFMEYFVAEKLKYEIERGNVEVLHKRLVPPEIMTFLVNIRSNDVTDVLSSLASIPQDDPFDSNAVRYFTKLPAAESVEFFLEKMYDKHNAGKGTLRTIFERVLLNARGEQEQEVRLALWNLAQFNPRPSVRLAAGNYLQRLGWGEIDRIGLLSEVLRGGPTRRIAKEFGVELKIVKALEKDWQSYLNTFPNWEHAIAALRDFQPIDIDKSDINAICRATFASPSLVRSFIYIFGQDKLAELTKYLKELKLKPEIKRKASDEIAEETINYVSKTSGLDVRSVQEILRKSDLEQKLILTRLDSIPGNRRTTIVRDISQRLGEPAWSVEVKLKTFALAAKNAELGRYAE